jgi:hypothetical protein
MTPKFLSLQDYQKLNAEEQSATIPGWSVIKMAAKKRGNQGQAATTFSSQYGMPWYISFPTLSAEQINTLKNTQQLTTEQLGTTLSTTPIMAKSICEAVPQLPLIEGCECKTQTYSPECKADICTE